MAVDNLSAILYGINDLHLEQFPLPSEPKENEVILESHTVGICGSDVHFLVEGHIGPIVVKEPIILGHESSATVVKVGPGVTKLKVGDRVAVEPNIPCRVCEACKGGRYNFCPDTKFFATPPYNGSLTRFYKHAVDFCYKLPDHVSYEEGALMEPLAVAVQASKRADLRAGDSVLVIGAGPIGMASILVAKAFGASRILVTDINEKRVQAAKKLGVDYSMVTTIDSNPLDNAKKVVELMGCEPNVTLECTGASSSVELGIYATKAGGVLTLIGMGSQKSSVDFAYAILKELDIRTSLRYANCYPITLELVASGKIDAKPLITHRFKLEDAKEAFEATKTGVGIKVLIKCKKED